MNDFKLVNVVLHMLVFKIIGFLLVRLSSYIKGFRVLLCEIVEN